MSYLKNLFTTGALTKTPRRILRKIAGEVDSKDLNLVVELGAGKGEITRNILDKTAKKCRYIAFEINPLFVAELRENFPQIEVLENDAFSFDSWIDQKADLLVCSLPLSFFDRKARQMLMEKMKNAVRENGKVIILFHAFWILPELKHFFPNYKMMRFFHLPPYYIISCTK